jgi:hypothetical protein
MISSNYRWIGPMPASHTKAAYLAAARRVCRVRGVDRVAIASALSVDDAPAIVDVRIGYFPEVKP